MAFASDIEFLDRLKGTPLGQKITGAIADERSSTRTALVARRGELLAAGAEERKRYEAGFEEAQRNVKATEAAFKDALSKARDVLGRHDAYRHSSEAEIREIERELTDTAPTAIADFLRWSCEEHHRALQSPLTEETALSDEINPTTGRKIVLLKTNAKAIAARAAALLAAKSVVIELAVTVADPTEITDRVRELRNGIPLI